MLKRYPDERNPQRMLFLARLRLDAHREAAAIPVLKDVLKEVPERPGRPPQPRHGPRPDRASSTRASRRSRTP